MGYGSVTQVGDDIVNLDALAEEVDSEMLEDDPELRDESVLAFARSIVEQMDGEVPDEELADTLRGLDDGGGLIHERYFEEYARQFADDIGAVQGEGWPTYCIDWEKAADELRMDYSTVDTTEGSYYFR